MSLSSSSSLPELEQENRLLQAIRHALERFRPALGWLIFLVCAWLGLLPGLSADANGWLDFSHGPRIRGALGVMLLGPLAVLVTWIVLGWRAGFRKGKFFRVATGVLILILSGLIALSQALMGWIPGPLRLLRTLFTNSWPTLLNEIGTDLPVLFSRVARWQSGVAAGGATQDDLIFAALVGGIIWLMGCVSAWLVRTQHSGLLTALPILTLLGVTIFYGPNGRASLLLGLLLALILHMMLHHHALEARWDSTNVGYSGDIFGERVLYTLAVGALIVMLAGIFPSISVDPLSRRYFELLAPVNEQVEDFGVRLFPDMKMTSRFRGSTLADGLPNSFLLSAGPELSRREVMRVRTDEAYFYEPSFPGEYEAPPGHYMRGGTLTVYDGLGWSNATLGDVINNPRESYLAETPIDFVADTQEPPDPESPDSVVLPPGRKLLTQDIFLTFSSSALYAAAEPLTPFVDYRLERHVNGDPLALWASSADRTLRSYTIASSIPAVSADQLAAEAMWDASTQDELLDLQASHALYLQLPETISERTRALAKSLTETLDSPYEKARAIELHLRTLPYDLSVTEPPTEVVDVADYFLFDLQRGYCDYYTTAFAVLARLSGLPTRFATGFAVGYFDYQDGVYVVTEAEAHSWPEVYFPTYGWIAFEPTAGRSELTRIGLPETISVIPGGDSSAVVERVNDDLPEPFWNWQMLVWLIPLMVLLWGAFTLWSRWRLRTLDPWLGLLRWGRRAGRPLAEGETVLEYGAGLADHTLADLSRAQDAKRHVAREVKALSQDVSSERYGPQDGRGQAREDALSRWRGLRGYLRQVR